MKLILLFKILDVAHEFHCCTYHQVELFAVALASYRSNVTVVESCTKCSLDAVDSYVLFCRTFFGFQYSFIGAGNANAAKNKQVHS